MLIIVKLLIGLCILSPVKASFSSFDTPIVKRAPAIEEDPYYSSVCAPDADVSGLIQTKEKNILPPDVIYHSLGRAWLNPNRTLTVPGKTSTLAFALKDLEAFEEHLSRAEHYEMRLSYQRLDTNTNETIEYATSGRTFADFCKTSLNQSIRCSYDSNYRNVYLEFTLPATSTIYEFEFAMCNQEHVGNFAKVQLSNTSVSNFPGFYDFDHAPCGYGVSPYPNNSTKEVTLEYGSDVSSLDSYALAYDYEEEKYIWPTVIKDEVSENVEVLNTPFEYVVQAEDSSGNVSTLTLSVTIVDTKPPEIKLKEGSSLKLSYQSDLTEDGILNLFEFTDNYQNRIASKVIEGVNFSRLETSLGKVNFVIRVKDLSDNEARYSGVLEIFDDIPPLIEGPSEYNMIAGGLMTEEELLGNYRALDEFDGECEIDIVENDYLVNYKKLGIYSVVLVATDISGNVGRKEILINVSDNSAPVFYLNGSVVTTYSDSKLDPTALLKSLVRSGEVPEDPTYVKAKLIEGEYDQNYTNPGRYQVVMQATSLDGSTLAIPLTIEVLAKELSGEEQVPEGLLGRITQFFKEMWKSIIDFFKKLFSSI